MKKVFLLILFSTVMLWAEEITIGVQERILERYETLLNGKDPLDVDDFTPYDRDVAELIMIVQMLNRTDFKEYSFKSFPTAKRLISEIDKGTIDISGTSEWSTSITGFNIEMSETLIDLGEFEVGIYVLEGRDKMQQVKTLDDLRALKFVSSKQWVVDWKTLESLEIDTIIDNPKWSGMVKMLQSGRADAMLAPFQSREDMKIIYEDGNLEPIRGIKLGLDDYRSILVNKKSAMSSIILEQLNREIKRLKDIKYMEKAYVESGFFNTRVSLWDTVIY